MLYRKESGCHHFQVFRLQSGMGRKVRSWEEEGPEKCQAERSIEALSLLSKGRVV